MSQSDASLAARIAAHRFGLGEARLATVGNDARGWLLAQIGPADTALGKDLPSGSEAALRYARLQGERVQARRSSSDPRADAAAGVSSMASASPAEMSAPAARQRPRQQASERPEAASAALPADEARIRDSVQADVRSALATAAATQRPFAERLSLFWANHFAVSALKGSVRGQIGAFEREAIRPHIAGRFEPLLKAAVKHGTMLRYLDNDQSAGPNSRVVQQLARRSQGNEMRAPRISGLNENLAREVLELHTLGAHSKAYNQADVTAFAAVLTGWRVPVRLALQGELAEGETLARFEPNFHEPGPKQLLGKRYPEGEGALDKVLEDLARHPATAQFLSLKLARHFVADEPPPELVARLAQRYLESDGDLSAVYRELVQAPPAWQAPAQKLKSPAEFVISSARVLGLGEAAFARQPDAGIATMGQRVHAVPSPAGWPDRAEEWLGPEAVWKRVEWASRVAERVGKTLDARALAQSSFGASLSASTAQQIDRAADGPQALALLLMSPEMQRR
jgi:uncharacterized protein (DUF1800 family)